jgi:hypothetical protein
MTLVKSLDSSVSSKILPVLNHDELDAHFFNTTQNRI